MKRTITTKDGALPVGPYSQAIEANGFLFLSGQIAIDPLTQELTGGGIREHTDRALKNIAILLDAAGSSAANVVRCVVYLQNMDDFAAMNEVYASFFNDDPPARTTLSSPKLPRNSLIEIEATAVRS